MGRGHRHHHNPAEGAGEGALMATMLVQAILIAAVVIVGIDTLRRF
jgi:hypothetical protein